MRPRRPFVAHPRHPVTGKQVRVSARTDRELAALLHDVDGLRIDLKHDRKSPEQVDRAIRHMVHGRVTLERIAASYAAAASPNTRRRLDSFLSVVARGLRSRDVYELDGPLIATWIAGLRAEGYEYSTIATAWRTLSALGRHAAERGWIAQPPWGAYRPARLGGAPRLREAARTVDELIRLLAAAEQLDAEREARGVWSFVHAKCTAIALLGLRQGELAGLRWADIDPPAMRVRVERQYDGLPLKNRRPGWLLGAEHLFQVLSKHAIRLGNARLFSVGGPVFPCPSTSTDVPRPYTHGECLSRLDLRTAVQLASLPSPERWAPTSLRDSFATLEEIGAGGDLRRLAERTRHASLSSLARYLRTRTREPAPPGFSPALARSDPPRLAETNRSRH